MNDSKEEKINSFMLKVKDLYNKDFKNAESDEKLDASAVLVGLAIGFVGSEVGNVSLAAVQLASLMVDMAEEVDDERRQGMN